MTIPTLTVITPSLNRVELIGDAIESALQGGYPYLEHIVVDGGSTDGTLESLAAYPNLRVVSEPDRGVYDALNKGLRLAQGEVIGFLNTDDFYTSGVLNKVMDLFSRCPDSMAVLGGAAIFSELGDDSRAVVAEFPPFNAGSFLEQVTWGVPLFNAWFFRRHIFEQYGCFDLRYRYAADRDFLIRLALENLPYSVLEETVYHYRRHSNSLTFNPQIDAQSGMVVEFREIAEGYLKRESSPNQTSRCFRRWHSLVTSHQVMLALRSLQPARSFRCAQLGLRYDPAWLRVFGGEMAARSRRKLFSAKPTQVYPDTLVGQ